MFTGLSYASIKIIQGAIYKCIMGPKKLNKGRQACHKTCIYLDWGLKIKHTCENEVRVYLIFLLFLFEK
jgi:hypothetical protein